MKIHKGDTVKIMVGKDAGKKGKVRQVFPEKKGVIVEGLNFIKRHSRTQGKTRQGGIIELEAPVDISNVMIICSKCNEPSRVGYKVLGDGNKVRICKSCQEAID